MKDYNVLDDFPEVSSLFGVDLRTGCFIIATLGIVHPIAYGCTCFLPMSYVMVSIWILLVVYCTASVGLFYGLTQNNTSICGVWIWIIIIITSILAILMVLLIVAYASRMQHSRAFLAFLGILWYVLTIYFIFVVNTHRKQLSHKNNIRSQILAEMPTEETAPIQTTTEESAPPKQMIRVNAPDSQEAATVFKMYLEIDPEKAKESLNVLQNNRRSFVETKNKISISTTINPDESDIEGEIKAMDSTLTEQSTSTGSTTRSGDEIPPGDTGESTDDFD